MQSEPGPGAWERVVQELAEAPGIGVAIMTLDGRILYHNREAVRVHLGDASASMVGRRLAEVFPEVWVEERLRANRRAVESGKAILLRALHRGVGIESVVRPIPDEEGEPARVLVITRQGRTPDEDVPQGMEIIELDVVSLGPLGALTPRELEVLALIGRGRSAREIGEMLGCSPRTVERHRDAIGKKLRKSDRVELALIANAAGLELRDARRKRVEPRLPPRGAGGVIEPKPDREPSRRRPGAE